MKRTLKYCLGLVLIPFAFSSLAQEKATLESPIKGDDLSTVVVTGNALVNKKIENAFTKQFKNAENTKWFAADKNFLVAFELDQQRHNALYKKNGSLIYNISYGSEKNLPTEVRSLVKSKYFDYSISTAINVKQNDANIWLINVEDQQNMFQVRVEDGEMKEIDHIRKSS